MIGKIIKISIAAALATLAFSAGFLFGARSMYRHVTADVCAKGLGRFDQKGDFFLLDVSKLKNHPASPQESPAR